MLLCRLRAARCALRRDIFIPDTVRASRPRWVIYEVPKSLGGEII